MNKFIPYGRHCVDDSDIAAVTEILRSDWLTCGSLVTQFEYNFCKVVNSKYAVACSNGTTALHLALLAIGITAGDKVIVPAITFLATANAVRYVGAEVIFADVDPDTGLMTAETLQQALEKENYSNRIKAVINVHLAGQCENLELIYKVAKQSGLFIIEDAAHALGTEYVGHNDGVRYLIGSNKFSDLTTFSFHPVKTITTGEGGMVTTNSAEYDQIMCFARSHGMVKEPENWINLEQGFDRYNKPNNWYYEMPALGYNYRISDINCALGNSQLRKLSYFKEERYKIVSYYDNHCNNKFIKPLKKLNNSITTWHLYILKINFNSLGKTRTQVMQELKNHGIGSQVHYIPLYKQPYYSNIYGHLSLIGTEEYYSKCLSLPLWVGLDEKDLNVILGILAKL